MNFKLEYLDEKKIIKFINKYELIELVIFEDITYASGIGSGMSNQVRSKTNCYNIKKKKFIEPSGFNNNLITKSISLRGEGLLGYTYLSLAYYEENLPELLDNHIKKYLAEYKCSISIDIYNSCKLPSMDKSKMYDIKSLKNENYNNDINEVKIASAINDNETISYITYSIKHFETTEYDIGHYMLILNNITVFNDETESLFYVIKEILDQYKDKNLTRIQFPGNVKEIKYIKNYIFPRLEQNHLKIEY